MSSWAWKPARVKGIWNCGAPWLRPLAAAVPYLTVMLLMVMLYLIGGTFTAAKGVLFELPEGNLGDGAATRLVALVMPMPHETLIFFDDSRYLLGDETSMAALGEHLQERTAQTGDHTLLVMADRRVAGGELMKLAAVVRQHGIKRLLMAEKKAENAE